MRGMFTALLLAVSATAVAQEGFPLDGTWRGELVRKDGSHRTIVLIIQWDGRQITGTVNPGPGGVDFTTGHLNPEGWKFSLDAQPAKGAPIHFDGAISDLGKYNRVLTGRWTEGGAGFDIRFVRE